VSNKIGRFEVISEIAKSTSGAVYKANDPDAGRTIALKTIKLDLPPDLARILVQLILQESETTKNLNSQNIALLYGAGEIEGQFCAAMEYVEGNSLANMIARQEGFSIWDLLDLSRQVCLALDHANSHGVLHRSLEPAKIMMQWDGTVKVLGYGVSTMVSAMPRKGAQVPPLFYYMAPEQVKGEVMDVRSNIFTWGAILYEMVTERKPFVGDDIQTVRQRILEETAEPPATINPRMNLSVSSVIMRALAKSPEERYQHGHELLADLEKAKETTQAKAAKQGQSPKGLVIPEKLKTSPGASGKFIVPQKSEAASSQKFAPTQSDIDEPETLNSSDSQSPTNLFEGADAPAPAAAAGLPKRAAAAAGVGVAGPASVSQRSSPTRSSPGTTGTTGGPQAEMSATAAERPVTTKPKFRTDPMMADSEQGGTKAVSFSDLEELPPLKEVFVAPSEATPETTPEPEPAPVQTFRLQPRTIKEDKPKIVTRENARKAVKEIKQVPPKLMMYSISAAVALVIAIALGIAYYNHHQNVEEEGAPPAIAEATPQDTTQPAQETSTPEADQASNPEPVVKPRYAPKKVVAAARPKPIIVPGELIVSSNPEGAQVHLDGQTNPVWVTPYTITGLGPGQHVVTVSKAGYASDTRNFEVTSGSKSSLSLNLPPLGAFVTIASEPAGATVFIDGKNIGHVTPAQYTAEKGSHTILVRKEGYLDETTTAEFTAGQQFKFSPVLKALGITEEIRTVGKFGKLFGGDKGAGMAKVSVKTQPKGAQVTVNRRMVDKATPVDFLLNPGNYIIDVTLSGYKPIHRVISLERNGKIELNENMEPQ
jgi:eukaryotic-like serine/threonine-protein kinase